MAMAEAADTYHSDMPSPELLDFELTRWKSKWERLSSDERPDTLASAIKACDPDCFPNIFVLLQIARTRPVTSCECERSASALHRLRTYVRATMGGDQQAKLALIHIHRDRAVDLEEVVDKFARLHPRRLQLDSIIKRCPTEDV